MVEPSHVVKFRASRISFEKAFGEIIKNTPKNSLNIESIALRLAHTGDDEVGDGISKLEKLYCFK